jgi:hypothetical protein
MVAAQKMKLKAPAVFKSGASNSFGSKAHLQLPKSLSSDWNTR